VERILVIDAIKALDREIDLNPLKDGSTSKKKPGRKKADYETVQREAQLAADWERARDSGTYKPEFAKQNEMTPENFNALLSRVAKRKTRSDK